MRLRIPLAFFLITAIGACESDPDRLKAAVVTLHVAKQDVDFDAPWLRTDTKTERHMAVAIGDGRFLTTAFAIEGAVNLQIQRDGNPYRVDAEVAHRDFDINLAILRPTEADPELADLDAVTIDTEDAIPDEQVTAVVPETDGRLTHKRGQVVGISQRSSVIGPYLLPTVELDIQGRKEMGWSEPIFFGGRLAGISTGSSDRYLTALAGNVLSSYVADASSDSYSGPASIGISIGPLTSPYHRQMLGADPTLGGVLVKQVFLSSAFRGILEPGDILTSIAGESVDERGFINRGGERLHFTNVVALSKVGDDVELGIIRAGTAKSVRGRLGPFNSSRLRIPYFRDGPEPYRIFGGAVFQELSKGFLEIWGKDWQEKAPTEFVFLWDHMNFFEGSIDERYVILNRILPDQVNRGYEQQKYMILDTVNGVSIKNLNELSAVLMEKPQQRDGKDYAVFRFRLDGGEIVLPYDELASAHARIRRQYNINDEANFIEPNKKQ